MAMLRACAAPLETGENLLETPWEFVQDAFRRLADNKPDRHSPLGFDLLAPGRPALIDKASKFGLRCRTGQSSALNCKGQEHSLICSGS
jgi:hypothetical protein